MDWIKVIQDVGFPIAVCAWFAFRNEKQVNALNQTVSNLGNTVGQLVKVVEILTTKIGGDNKSE